MRIDAEGVLSLLENPWLSDFRLQCLFVRFKSADREIVEGVNPKLDFWSHERFKRGS